MKMCAENQEPWDPCETWVFRSKADKYHQWCKKETVDN